MTCAPKEHAVVRHEGNIRCSTPLWPAMTLEKSDLARRQKRLGTTVLDGELSFAEHIKQLSNGCFYQLRQLWSIRRLLTKESAKTLVHATVLSQVDYCNSVLNRVCAVHLCPYIPYCVRLHVSFCSSGLRLLNRSSHRLA